MAGNISAEEYRDNPHLSNNPWLSSFLGVENVAQNYMTKADFDAWAAKQQPLQQAAAQPNAQVYQSSYSQPQQFAPLQSWYAPQQPSFGFMGGYGGGYGMQSPFSGYNMGYSQPMGYGGYGMGYGQRPSFGYGQSMGGMQSQFGRGQPMGYGNFQQQSYGGFQNPFSVYQQPTQNFSQAGFAGK